MSNQIHAEILIAEMAALMRTHNLDKTDILAKLILDRADIHLSAAKENDDMIEAIRIDNLHPLAG